MAIYRQLTAHFQATNIVPTQTATNFNMTWKDGGGRVLGTLPSGGFWIASACGALLLVGGSAATFFDFRDYRGDLSKSAFVLVAIVGLGIGLIALAFLAERRGRAHRAIVIVRNSLITLVVLAGLLAVLLIIVGPLH